MANIRDKTTSILAGNLNLSVSYLITTVKQSASKDPLYFGGTGSKTFLCSWSLLTLHCTLLKFYYIEKEGVFYATYAIFYTTIMYWGMHYYILGNINKMHS